MDRLELENYMKLDYEQLCRQMRLKYGAVIGSYFLTEACTRVNDQIKKGRRGLHIHHIMEKGTAEKTYANLSDPKIAKECPFEFQQGYNLCYCNILEHLLLHVKISLMRKQVEDKRSGDGARMLIGLIDYLYRTDGSESEFSEDYFKPIKSNYEQFVQIANMLQEDS